MQTFFKKITLVVVLSVSFLVFGTKVNAQISYIASSFLTPTQFFWETYGALVMLGILVLVTLIICRMIWYTYGKDPDEGYTIKAEYKPPQGVTLFEASYLLHEKIIPKAIGATLLYEAQHGVMQIEGHESDKFFGKFKKLLFKLILLQEPNNKASKKLLDVIFGVTSSIDLSSVQLGLEDISTIKKVVEEDLITKGYFDKIIGMNKKEAKIGITMVVTVGSLFMFLTILPYLVTTSGALHYYVSGYVIFLLICVITTYNSLTRKTNSGVDLKYKLLGLKLYINVSEEERIAFHNPPAKTPELFLTLLPWAIFFGLEKKWSKEFEGMIFLDGNSSTSYYTGFGSGVSLSAFGLSMEQFSAVAVISSTPSPRECGPY